MNSLPHLQRFGRVASTTPRRWIAAIGEAGASAADGAASDQAGRHRTRRDRGAPATSCCWSPIRRPGPWTRRCVRHSDEMLLLADATQPAAVHAAEQACLDGRPPRIEAAEILVLLHPADARDAARIRTGGWRGGR